MNSVKNFMTVWGYGFTSGFLAGALGAAGGISLVTFLMALGMILLIKFNVLISFYI